MSRFLRPALLLAAVPSRWWRKGDRTLERMERQERTVLQRLQRYTPAQLEVAMQRIVDEAKEEHPLWLEAPHARPYSSPPMDTGTLR